jgi:hypothetical protein
VFYNTVGVSLKKKLDGDQPPGSTIILFLLIVLVTAVLISSLFQSCNKAEVDFVEKEAGTIIESVVEAEIEKEISK